MIAHVRSNPFAHSIVVGARQEFEIAQSQVHVARNVIFTSLAVFDALEEALAKVDTIGPVSKLRVEYKLIDENSCVINCNNGYKRAQFYIDEMDNVLQLSNKPSRDVLAKMSHIYFLTSELPDIIDDVISYLSI